jgi:hypothetical protein
MWAKLFLQRSLSLSRLPWIATCPASRTGPWQPSPCTATARRYITPRWDLYIHTSHGADWSLGRSQGRLLNNSTVYVLYTVHFATSKSCKWKVSRNVICHRNVNIVVVSWKLLLADVLFTEPKFHAHCSVLSLADYQWYKPINSDISYLGLFLIQPISYIMSWPGQIVSRPVPVSADKMLSF